MSDVEEDSGGLLIRFVLPRGKTEITCSEDLGEAFDQSQMGGLNPSWIESDECLTLRPGKTDVFVMDPFEGDAFNHISTFKCTIVGPRCLLTCLNKGEPVPELPYPMYTAAMKNLVVTSTGFNKDKKRRLQMEVERMGGIFTNAFHDGVTHLVADKVRSQKYDVAVQKEIPVMTEEWVAHVWEKGKHHNIHAIDPLFSRFKCPALLGIKFTVSQMNRKDKELLKRSIESHGGVYAPDLDMTTTEILIITKPEGDKYKYAKKWRIPCLSSDWVFASIEKGYCLKSDGYRIDGTNSRERASTPTAADETAAKLSEVSMCSTIMMPDDTTVTNNVNETVNLTSMTILEQSAKSVDQLLVVLDPFRVKRSGAFLVDSNAKVFLSGFNEAQQEQLRRCIESSGATRMNQLTKSVTHVIVATKTLQQPDHIRVMRDLELNPHLVSLHWLVESMQMGRAVPESDFQLQKDVSVVKAIGPTPKSSATSNFADRPENEDEFEDELMEQYRNASATLPPKLDDHREEDEEVQFKVPGAITLKKTEDSQRTGDDESSRVERFLSDKKVALVGFQEDVEAEQSEWITEAGGEIVFGDFDGVLDYLIVPADGVAAASKFNARQVVSIFWLEDCLDAASLLDVEYFHRPLEAAVDLRSESCEDIVIGITNYSGKERVYIVMAAEALGMTSQDVFAKRDKNGAKKSTHLICSAPEGSKYEHGIKWNIPVVSKDWILACLEESTWVSEQPFLIGSSTAYDKSKPLPKCQKPPSDDVYSQELDLEKLRPRPIDFTNSTTPSRWMAPDSQQTPRSSKKKRCDEDVPYVLKGMKTPDTPYGAFLGDANPSSKTRKYWKKAYEELGKFKFTDQEKIQYLEQRKRIEEYVVEQETEREESIKEIEETGRKFSSKEESERIHEATVERLKAKGVPIVGQEGKSFDQLMEEKLSKAGKSWKNPTGLNLEENEFKEEDVFKGVAVYVAKKLECQREEIQAVVESLGGTFHHHYCPEVTHVVFQSNRKNDPTKEFRLAREDKKFVVSPNWIHMCRDEGERIDEAVFSHTYNPKLSVSMSVSSSLAPAAKRSKRDEGGGSSNKEKLEPIRQNASELELSAHLAKFNQLVDSKVDEASDNEEKERRASIRMDLTSGETREDSGAVVEPTTTTQGLNGSNSQIRWLDPQEEIERRKLAAKLAKETQALVGGAETRLDSQTFDTLDVPENLTEQLAENDKENTNDQVPSESRSPEPSAGYRCFATSGVAEEVQTKFAKFLSRHGIDLILDRSIVDDKVTHIVAQKMSRSEKMLGGVASGKWILHWSYMKACEDADAILPEAGYEWGDPNNFFRDFPTNPVEVKLAEASHVLRFKEERNAPRIFSGIKAIVHANEPRRSAFKKLLELGGADVLKEVRPPYSDPKDATHCIAEVAKLSNVPIDYKALAVKGVAVVNPLYINEYLTSNPPPTVDSFLVEAFKPHWHDKRRNVW